MTINCNVGFVGFVFVFRDGPTCLDVLVTSMVWLVFPGYGRNGEVFLFSQFLLFWHFRADCTLDDDFRFLTFGNNRWRGVISFHNTIMLLLFCVLLMWWYFIVLGGIVGGWLVVSLGVVSRVFVSGLGDCIRCCIGVLIPGTLESSGGSDSISFVSNFY